MKKIGIIGGIGPESTLDYYREIINLFKPSYQTNGYPEIIIESLNLKSIVNLAENNEWNNIAKIISEKFEYLRNSGAEIGVIASNSPHRVFNEIQNNTKLPLISIVSVTCNYIKKLNLKNVCLLGTMFTMKSDFFIKELLDNDINVVLPNNEEINYIQDKLMNEIELGIIKEETKKQILKIINRIIETSNIQGVIMGCTELPHIIKENDIDVEYIDTTKIHINSIVNYSKNSL